MGDKYTTFNPEARTLDDYLELIMVAFRASAVMVENIKVSTILTHILTNYFDNVLALIASTPATELSMNCLKEALKQ